MNYERGKTRQVMSLRTIFSRYQGVRACPGDLAKAMH